MVGFEMRGGCDFSLILSPARLFHALLAFFIFCVVLRSVCCAMGSRLLVACGVSTPFLSFWREEGKLRGAPNEFLDVL